MLLSPVGMHHQTIIYYSSCSPNLLLQIRSAPIGAPTPAMQLKGQAGVAPAVAARPNEPDPKKAKGKSKAKAQPKPKGVPKAKTPAQEATNVF